MKIFKIIFSSIFLASLISCEKNEPKEKDEIETNYTQTSNINTETAITNTEDTENTESNTGTESNETEETDINSDSGLAAAIKRQILNSNSSNAQNNNPNLSQNGLTPTITEKNAEAIINSPLRNLLKNAQMGKSYSKNELIEDYKFPKEAVDLIKQVTCVGQNKLYFKWGSTWFVEKVSDAKFENDTMIFTFKKNRTYVSGGAIGIKYNKKIYTELILNNGSAYIPSVKGYHWEINK